MPLSQHLARMTSAAVESDADSLLTAGAVTTRVNAVRRKPTLIGTTRNGQTARRSLPGATPITITGRPTPDRRITPVCCMRSFTKQRRRRRRRLMAKTWRQRYCDAEFYRSQFSPLQTSCYSYTFPPYCCRR